MNGSPARIANVLLGVWLVLSTFAWEHTQAQVTNSWVVGAALVVLGLLSLAVPSVRYFIRALAIWLLVSAFALPADGSTIWNNAIVAVLVFALSLVPERERHAGPFSHHRRVGA